MAKKKQACNDSTASTGATPAPESKAVSTPLNAAEKAMVQRQKEQSVKARSPARFIAKKDNKTSGIVLEVDSDSGNGDKKDKVDLLAVSLCNATGVKDPVFGGTLYEYCVSATGLAKGKELDRDAMHCTAVLNALHNMQPQDEIEGMLITRLISIHFQSMKYLHNATSTEITAEARDLNINRSTKLMRVYNETLETLMRYRRKGEQKVIVQHVNVANGGQAIVAETMISGGGAQRKNDEVIP